MLCADENFFPWIDICAIQINKYYYYCLVTSPVMYQQAYQDFTPQSFYGNPPLYVPLQSQPPQPSPVYVLPSPDNTQQITEALAKVTQLHRLPQAKPDVSREEDEDKTKFFLWESAFDALRLGTSRPAAKIAPSIPAFRRQS